MSRAPTNPTESFYQRVAGLPFAFWRSILEWRKSKERARESALRETEKAIAKRLANLSRAPLP
ncbi:MAG: hypothetical protein AB7T14_09005, partial [Candidatus Methylacidiphilaceae bacterium]